MQKNINFSFIFQVRNVTLFSIEGATIPMCYIPDLFYLKTCSKTSKSVSSSTKLELIKIGICWVSKL